MPRLERPLLLFVAAAVFYAVDVGAEGGADDSHAQVDSHTEVDSHVNGTHTDDAHADDAHAEEHGEHGIEVVSMVFFSFFSLLAGALCRQYLAWVPVPYTVLLLIFGLILGALADTWLSEVDLVVSFVAKASEMDPHLLLHIFLPPLLFESAFAIDYHIFRKTATKVALLAVPGLLINTFLMGLISQWIFYEKWEVGFDGGTPDHGTRYHWEFPELLLLGGILSATDPVAVVALLRDLGASKKLATLIEGESLMNDGTAVVFFIVLNTRNLYYNEDLDDGRGDYEMDWGGILLKFFQMSFGGAAFGYLMGQTAQYCMFRVFNDAMVEITLTLTFAYLTFFIAENYLIVSGVLAVCFMGFSFAEHGHTAVSPQVEHFLHEFWQMLGYIANTLIFVLTGVVIMGKIIIPELNEESGGNFSTDIKNGFLIYIGCTVCRGFCFVLAYPIFKRLEYGFSWSEAIVCCWGGLRGAVGLALALVVFPDESWPPEVRRNVLFHTSFIVLMTLIVNATTTKYVLEALGMTKPSPSKAKIMHNASEELLDVMENKLQEIKINPYLCNANMALVRRYCVDEVEKLVLDLFKKGADLEEDQPALRSGAVAPQNLALWKEVRRRVLVALKANFCKQFSEGVVGSQAFLVLERECSEAFDEDSNSIMQWKALSPYLKVSTTIQRMQDWPAPIGPAATKWVFMTLTLGSDIASSFGVAHEQVLRQIEETNLIQNHKTQADIVHLLKTELDQAKTVLHQMDSIFPEIAVSISTRHSIRRLLNSGESCIKALNKKGMIDELEAQTFIRRIEAQLKHLVFFPPSIPLPSKEMLFHEIEWMNTLDEDTFNMLCHAAKPQLFNPNELILKQGEVSNYVFIVARGSVNVLVNVNGEEREIQHKGVGLTLGEISLLKGIPRSSTVRALTGVLTFKLPFAAMFRAMHHYPPLHISLWKFACFHIAENTLLSQCEFQSLTWLQLRKIVHQWKVVHVHETGQDSMDSVFSENLSHSVASIDLMQGEGASIKNREDTGDYTPVKKQLLVSEQIYPADTAMMLIHGICDEYDDGSVMPTRDQEDEHVYQPPVLGDDLACYDEDKKDKEEAADKMVPCEQMSEHDGHKGSGLLRRFTKMPKNMRVSSGKFNLSPRDAIGSGADEMGSVAAGTAAARKKSVLRFEHTMQPGPRKSTGPPLCSLQEDMDQPKAHSVGGASDRIDSNKKTKGARRNSLLNSLGGMGRKSSISQIVMGTKVEGEVAVRPKPKRQHSTEMSSTLEKMYGKKRQSIFKAAPGKRLVVGADTEEAAVGGSRRRSSERIPAMQEPLAIESQHAALHAMSTKRGSTSPGLATINNLLHGGTKNVRYSQAGRQSGSSAMAMPLRDTSSKRIFGVTRVIHNMKKNRLTKMGQKIQGNQRNSVRHSIRERRPVDSSVAPGLAPDVKFDDAFTRFRAPCYLPPSPGRARFVHKGSVILLAPSDLAAVEDILDVAPMMLKNIHWIKGCNKDSIDSMAHAAQHVSYRPEDVLMVTGDLANDVFIIVSGIVKIVMEIDGISRVVASEGEGACIGELALLNSDSGKERRRGASVIAKTQVRTLTISYDVLEKVMQNDISLEAALWRKASLITTENLVTDLDAFKPWTQKRLQDYLKTWEYKIVSEEEGMVMSGPLALVTGSYQPMGANDALGKMVNAPILFPDIDIGKLLINKKSRVLVPPDLAEWRTIVK